MNGAHPHGPLRLLKAHCTAREMAIQNGWTASSLTYGGPSTSNLCKLGIGAVGLVQRVTADENADRKTRRTVVRLQN